VCFHFRDAGPHEAKTKGAGKTSLSEGLICPWLACGWLGRDAYTSCGFALLVQDQFSMPGLPQSIHLISVPDEHFIPVAENRLRVDTVCADPIPDRRLNLLVRAQSFHAVHPTHQS
jgi:hypothetical protein